jgi:hypothetical protein
MHRRHAMKKGPKETKTQAETGTAEWADVKQRILEACIESQLHTTHKAYFIDRIAHAVLGERYVPFIKNYNKYKKPYWYHGSVPREVDEDLEKTVRAKAAELEFFEGELPLPETMEEDMEKTKTYQIKGMMAEAEQWLRVEYDVEATSSTPPVYHLGVGYYRHPHIGGHQVCGKCSAIYHTHGWIEEADIAVCPGDYIFCVKPGEFYPVPARIFKLLFEEAE